MRPARTTAGGVRIQNFHPLGSMGRLGCLKCLADDDKFLDEPARVPGEFEVEVSQKWFPRTTRGPLWTTD